MFQLALFTGLVWWRARRRGWQRVARGVAVLGGAIALATLPHTLYGWRVQEHVPAAYLGPQMVIAGGWYFFALLVGFGLWIWDGLASRLPGPTTPVDPSRRRLLTHAPVLLGVAAPVGMVEGAHEPEPTPVRIASPKLPAAFHGLRVLQISDLHLGPCLGLDWLERALARAASTPVDLVAVTGDLSDDVELMRPALARIAAVPARFGHVAIPGNHEHYVGIDRFVQEVKASPVRLLTGEVLTLTQGTDALQVVGIDYPHLRGIKDEVQFASFLDGALSKAGPGFKLLLSHHPDALDQAAARAIDVVLAGHTHGGQINILGRSLLAGWLKYPRGRYTVGATQMFVTTGLGHWMPFRVSCPTELPVIELARG
ncbi:MAG: metallophosphoesterase family protein [Deltaproteobacteria bacterium]|nr:metallophosphoesterase family protein [Deltaproteobacteria bacterium]